MKTNSSSRLLKIFLAASLPMPILHALLFFLWHGRTIEPPIAVLLLTGVTMVGIGMGILLISRRSVNAHEPSSSSHTGQKDPPNGSGGRQAATGCSEDYVRQAQQDLRRLEEQLFQAQKMEAIGTLAGGIAHDFNNVLAAIMGYVELAIFDADPRSKVTFELEQILKATHRAKDLVQQILSYSRRTDRQCQPMDLNPLIKEALKLIRASIPATIDIRQDLETTGCLVQANTTQMHQVMMNLCTNASQAMTEKGGNLTVELHKKDLMGSAAASQGINPGRYLELTVADTGPGIDPELKERIFDPYFTTKAEGQGTGLGLAVVRSIVQNHGGTIEVQCTPGQGACFRVLLPATTALPELPSGKECSLPQGSESVLFVDDEPMLAELGERMLSRLGYRVTSCCRPDEVLDLVREKPDDFDVLITDATMPGMTGDVLAEQVLRVRSDIPVILCTGYSEKITPERAARIGIEAFVMKPLSIHRLARTLRQVLDDSSSAHLTHYLKAFPD